VRKVPTLSLEKVGPRSSRLAVIDAVKYIEKLETYCGELLTILTGRTVAVAGLPAAILEGT
jgi:hypothetical protein